MRRFSAEVGGERSGEGCRRDIRIGNVVGLGSVLICVLGAGIGTAMVLGVRVD